MSVIGVVEVIGLDGPAGASHSAVCHCWNLTLSADLTGFRVLCCRIDSTDGSSLMDSTNDGGLGDSSFIRGRGASGCSDSGGVENFLSSVDSCLGFSGSSANVEELIFF